MNHKGSADITDAMYVLRMVRLYYGWYDCTTDGTIVLRMVRMYYGWVLNCRNWYKRGKRVVNCPLLSIPPRFTLIGPTFQLLRTLQNECFFLKIIVLRIPLFFYHSFILCFTITTDDSFLFDLIIEIFIDFIPDNLFWIGL